MKTLIDVFDEWDSGGGIFTALQSFDVPWKSENIAASLDLEYYGNISGDKNISPLIKKYMSGDSLTYAEISTLAALVFKINAVSWAKEWATLAAQYNPIENYSMVEQMTNDQTIDAYGRTHTRTDNLSHTKTGTETDTPNTTETTTPNLTSTRDAETYGFNSSNPVPTDSDSQHATGTNTVTKTGTEQRTYNTTDADTGTQTDADTGQDTHTRNYRLSRSGNIGVTTSQQMLESERNLWLWNFFYSVVFPDINRVLTIQIY